MYKYKYEFLCSQIMVWNLEENTDNPEELSLYKHVLKSSKNPKFAKTLIRFLNLYEYIKLQKYRSANELRQDILSHGQPLFTERESEEIFDMSIMRGGESKYPFLNNVFRQFLGWIYKWSPDILANFMDTASSFKERLEIFKHIRENYQLGEVYGLILDFITEMIPMNVTILENIANELPIVGPVSGLIATMISSILISFNNILHFTQGDDGAVIVDSFLMLPFIGTSLRSLALSVEKQAGTLSEKRQKLIESIRLSFGNEEAQLISEYIPDLDNIDSYQLPSITNSAQVLAQKYNIPTSLDAAQNIAQDMAQQQVNKINSLGTALPYKAKYQLNQRLGVIGAKRLTSSRPHKKKWGTLKKSNL